MTEKPSQQIDLRMPLKITIWRKQRDKSDGSACLFKWIMKFLRNKCDKISSYQGGEKYRTRREVKRHTVVKSHGAELEVEGSAMYEDGRRRVVDVQKGFDGEKKL